MKIDPDALQELDMTMLKLGEEMSGRSMAAESAESFSKKLDAC